MLCLVCDVTVKPLGNSNPTEFHHMQLHTECAIKINVSKVKCTVGIIGSANEFYEEFVLLLFFLFLTYSMFN